MNRQKLVRIGGIDKSNYGIILASMLLAIYNSIDLIVNNDPFYMYMLYLMPFVLYPLISLIWNPAKLPIIIFTVVGLLTIILDSKNSGASGVVYIGFAYGEQRSSRNFFVLAGLSLFSLTLRFIILGTAGIDAITPILLFVFIFTTFYFKVVKQPKQIKNIDLLKEEEKAIVKLYCSGYSYEKISKTLSLNIVPSTLRRKITAIKDLNDINNDAQFGKWLHELV